MAALVVGASLIATICSGCSSPPSYCDKLDHLPGELKSAITAATSGTASDGDRVVIARASDQLKSAEADSSMPTDTHAEVDKAIGILNRLAQGQSFGAGDMNAFSSLEGMEDQCSQQ